MADAAITMTIAELAPKIKAKAISPVELTEAVLFCKWTLQPVLNSFITIPARAGPASGPGAGGRPDAGEYRGPCMVFPLASRTTSPLLASAPPSVQGLY